MKKFLKSCEYCGGSFSTDVMSRIYCSDECKTTIKNKAQDFQALVSEASKSKNRERCMELLIKIIEFRTKVSFSNFLAIRAEKKSLVRAVQKGYRKNLTAFNFDRFNLIVSKAQNLPACDREEIRPVKKHRKVKIPNSVAIAYGNKIDNKEFYTSKEWLRMRYRVLVKYGQSCQLCGSTKKPMHVDHIKPRSIYPHLELEFENLQVLCKECNLGKSNLDETDFRPKKDVRLATVEC